MCRTRSLNLCKWVLRENVAGRVIQPGPVDFKLELEIFSLYAPPMRRHWALLCPISGRTSMKQGYESKNALECSRCERRAHRDAPPHWCVTRGDAPRRKHVRSRAQCNVPTPRLSGIVFFPLCMCRRHSARPPRERNLLLARFN